MEIEKVEFCTNEAQEKIMGSFECPKVKRMGVNILIPSNYVVDQICLVHECSGGKCSFREAETTTMVEREAVTKVKFSYEHNNSHNYYLVNKFYLGAPLKYFNVA